VSGQEIQKWGDAAMFRSEPMPVGAEGPAVTLLNATPDPLGSLAALCAMYGGKVVRSLADVTDDDRRMYFTEVTKSALQGPLEAVTFHFLVENVTRSFTHQMVRGRNAFYAQESLRFAVPEEDWETSGRIALPPTLAGTMPLIARESEKLWEDPNDYMRDVWDNAVAAADEAYSTLISHGMPAEDARGIMPHNITTRLHWVCSLRELLHVAGLRLCTQAQFEWRSVMASAVKALREYRQPRSVGGYSAGSWSGDGWQFALIADRLRPVCYQTGSCGFKSKMDRPCTIRERVDRLEHMDVPSSEWETTDAFVSFPTGQKTQLRIDPREWALNPKAAR
jgi:flavin-dependent thymidylate synthase